MNGRSPWLAVVLVAVLAACSGSSTTGYVPPRRDAGPDPGDFCAEECTSDTQCLSGFRCVNTRCVSTATPDDCFDDYECRARAGGWSSGCLQDGACPANHACVGTRNTEGYCARIPSTAAPCSSTGHDNLTLPRKDNSGDVAVCGMARARCGADNQCFTACTQDLHCGGEYPLCNVVTGVCVCAATSCVTNASACVSGRCECQRDSDCTVVSDKCINGACGCSGVAVCEGTARAHPGTTWVCE